MPKKITLKAPAKNWPTHAEDDSPKHSPSNEQRAAAAMRAVMAFDPDPEEWPTSLQDVLSNIGHLCDFAGLDLQDILRMAASNYDAETRNQGTQFTRVS